jgi:sulfide:quinone oxidoreductase
MPLAPILSSSASSSIWSAGEGGLGGGIGAGAFFLYSQELLDSDVINATNIGPLIAIIAVGVCVAIPPTGPTPVPCGVPKTGFMIESMVTATAKNIGQILRGQEPGHEGTWNAFCLADFGTKGVAFVAQPQIPPRNVNWSSHGRWVHTAKVAFEKYFMAKVKRGKSETFYEKAALNAMGIEKLKAVRKS